MYSTVFACAICLLARSTNGFVNWDCCESCLRRLRRLRAETANAQYPPYGVLSHCKLSRAFTIRTTARGVCKVTPSSAVHSQAFTLLPLRDNTPVRSALWPVRFEWGGTYLYVNEFKQTRHLRALSSRNKRTLLWRACMCNQKRQTSIFTSNNGLNICTLKAAVTSDCVLWALALRRRLHVAF